MNFASSAPSPLLPLLPARCPAQAQSVEEFYKGKTITLAIGFTPGGGYDLYARHLARHMSKYIPGRPTIVPQNMAGAGQPARRELHLLGGAQGRHRVRHLRAHHRHQPAARERRHLRRHQVHLARQRDQRHLALRDLAHLEGQHLGELPEAPDHHGRAGAELGARHLRQSLQERVRRADQARARLSRHQRDHARDGARRGRRPVRAVLEHDQDPPPAVAEGEEDQPPGAGRLQEGAGDRQRAAGHGPDQGPREAADPEAHPRRAGNGAAVRGAARHSARPRRRADRRLRRHHEGHGLSGRRQEIADRRQSGERRERSTSCSPSSTPRPRT